MKNIQIVITLCASSLVSCASNGPDVTLARNPRIEYRDLTVQLQDNQPSDTIRLAGLQPSETVLAESAETMKPIFIDFANDSARVDAGQIKTEEMLVAANAGKHFFIVGHSHGGSAVGVSSLSVQRANAVARTLIQSGVNPRQVHTLASWSDAKEPFAPTRGAQIFVTGAADLSRALLALQAG